MKAILVRIGVDQAYGHWNAPVNAEGRFAYVPIPEKIGTAFRLGLKHPYSEVTPALDRFYTDNRCHLSNDLKFPSELLEYPMHLDPDTEHLTYGDDGGRRGAGVVGMTQGDLIAFYGGLRPIYPFEHKLVYALVALYVVHEVLSIHKVLPHQWRENAHTRKQQWGETDIIVRTMPGVSGRLDPCIPIGEVRDGAYRVRKDLLDVWGGLSVKDASFSAALCRHF